MPSGTLDARLGIEVLELTEENAVGRFSCGEQVMQPLGLVHGGAYAALAETLASAATQQAVGPGGAMAVGLSNHPPFSDRSRVV